MSEVRLYKGDCVEVMRGFEDGCIDLTVTSPPYDNLRTYKGTCEWDFEVFKRVAGELYRITKDGGVVVWVVGDATINGSETGTSFRQALYFKEIGFNLHDTMIWEKTGMLPTQDRYYNIFEYMFVFSKNKPKSMNFICDHKTTAGGRVQKKDACINKGSQKVGCGFFVRNEFSRRTNIWRLSIGKNEETQHHPAVFPELLAYDHILSWSNEGDVVLDCFLGSGTTGKMAVKAKRNFVGIEKVDEYFEIAERRISDEQKQLTLF